MTIDNDINDTVTKTIPTVPASLSGLVRLAVADARGLDRGVYVPNCAVWHDPVKSRCHVSLPGAIVASTLGFDRGVRFAPHEHRAHPWHKALCAVSTIGMGLYGSAAARFYADAPVVPDGFPDGFNVARLPKIALPGYYGWGEFDLHLVSLDVLADRLAEDGF